MSDSPPRGPELDALAAAAIKLEEERHRRRLGEIEQIEPAKWNELLSDENELHLKLLTEAYTALAERRLQRHQPAD